MPNMGIRIEQRGDGPQYPKDYPTYLKACEENGIFPCADSTVFDLALKFFGNPLMGMQINPKSDSGKLFYGAVAHLTELGSPGHGFLCRSIDVNKLPSFETYSIEKIDEPPYHCPTLSESEFQQAISDIKDAGQNQGEIHRLVIRCSSIFDSCREDTADSAKFYKNRYQG